MRIGELARLTGVPARRLRYYEDHGLLTAQRAANGYRDYGQEAVQRVSQIRGLIEAGIPTAIIADIIPCLDDSGAIEVDCPAPELLRTLEQHRDLLDARVQCISRNRDAIGRYLDAVRARSAQPGEPAR